MALAVKKGTITTARTTAGTQAYAHGLGTTPQALIFFTTGMSAAGTALQAPSAIGFAVSSTQRATVAGYSDYDTGGESNATTTQLGTSNTGKDTRDTAALTMLWGGDPVINAVADLVSIDATNFTLNWTDPANVATRVIHYVALGGTDITNVAVTTHSVTRLTAGTEDYTVTGNFQPDCIILMSASPHATAGTSAVDDTVCLGWACVDPSATLQQTCFAWMDDDAATLMRASAGSRNDACLLLPQATDSNSPDGQASLDSFLATGFRLNWTDPVAATAGRTFYSLAIKGGAWSAGAMTKPTASGAQNVTGLPFQPKGALFSLMSTATENPGYVNSAGSYCFSIGATDGTADGCISNLQVDNNTSSQARNVHSTTRVLHTITGTTGANAGDYDITALNADGFSGTWANADATAYPWHYLAMGDTFVPPAAVIPSLVTARTRT